MLQIYQLKTGWYSRVGGNQSLCEFAYSRTCGSVDFTIYWVTCHCLPCQLESFSHSYHTHHHDAPFVRVLGAAYHSQPRQMRQQAVSLGLSFPARKKCGPCFPHVLALGCWPGLESARRWASAGCDPRRRGLRPRPRQTRCWSWRDLVACAGEQEELESAPCAQQHQLEAAIAWDLQSPNPPAPAHNDDPQRLVAVREREQLSSACEH